MTNNVEVTRGADLEIVFDGSPGHVRSFNYDDEFGLMLADVDPELALDILASDPQADSVWQRLGAVFEELANSGCNTAEIVDYLATAKCGFDPEDWASMTDANGETVKRNARQAASNLREARSE